jgi:hypothetical protein
MKLWSLCAFLFYFSGGGVVVSYDGNNMLLLLGQSNTSQTFKDFTKFWLLDDVLENRSRGVKVFVNPVNNKIESITITGEVADLSDTKFSKYHGKLPVNINLEDDTAALSAKLGHSEKLPGRTTLRFRCGSNLKIDATYSNFKKGKITYLTFSNESGKPLVLAEVLSALKKRASTNSPVQTQAPVATQALPKGALKVKAVNTAVLPPLKKAIFDVFNASRESSFASIKGSNRAEGNFWNYKYTYGTSVKIPGEKYNMLYSFPFITSQLDFVSVLKESDSYDKSFEVIYHDFEKQLTANFPASEGWIATCLPAKDKNPLPNLEFRNDAFGAVILDHTRNPTGKHILYLRFLLFAN